MRAHHEVQQTTRRIVRRCMAVGVSVVLTACSLPGAVVGPAVESPDAAEQAAPLASRTIADEHGAHGDHAAHTAASTARPQHTDHAVPTPSSQARSSAAPVTTIRISGSGERNSGSFKLKRGLVAFHFHHPTSTPFGSFLLNANGEHLALLANGSVVTGTQVFGVQTPGDHSLHVLAADAWSVDIEHLEEIGPVDNVPAQSSGHGGGVTSPLVLPAGELLAHWTHSGTFPATVVGWSVDGQQRLDAFSNLQGAKSTVPLRVSHGGTYLFNVLADGAWTLVIEPR